MTVMQSKINAAVSELAPELIRMSDEIAANPQIAFEEEYASKTLMIFLEKQGFQIHENAAGLSTAFVAQTGEGLPVTCFLGEYDALPGLGSNGLPGHGCGHNLLGVAAAGAAVALAEYQKEMNLQGTVRFYGCPAEESGCGKEIMAKAGLFSDVTSCFAWHPAAETKIISESSLANIIFTVNYLGKSSHAASDPEKGRSALDACELMNLGANYLREHISPDVRFHYAYTDCGGVSPNVVQASASLLYYVRAESISAAREVTERLRKIANGAALMTETECTFTIQNEMLDFRPDDNLSRVLADALREYFPDTEDYSPSDRHLPISSDVGNVSQIVPTAQVYLQCFSPGTAFHSASMVQQATSEQAHQGILSAAAVLALAGAKKNEI